MKKYLFLFYSFFLIILLTDNLKTDVQNSIVVKVDKKIITSFEIKNKILSTLVVAGNEITQANIDNLKSQILENLIFLKLKEIELENINITLNINRVNDILNQVSGNDLQKLKKEFSKNGLDFDLWVKDIKTEVKWQQFIFLKYSNKIEIDEVFLNNEIKRILNSDNQIKEVNLSEIEIYQSEEVTNDILIKKIIKEIANSGFDNTALKLSVSNSSSEKGNVGWINIKTLSKEIINSIKDLKPGQVSDPIIKANSILFLKVNSERISKNINYNKDELKKSLIKQKKNEMLNLYSRSHLSKLRNNYLIEYK